MRSQPVGQGLIVPDWIHESICEVVGLVRDLNNALPWRERGRSICVSLEDRET